ncbi:MAG: hypothetical protein PHE55_04690 [Methylococcaceae bacterium]|nr:hypothetical protein [Methylococcaceae bacterium]
MAKPQTRLIWLALVPKRQPKRDGVCTPLRRFGHSGESGITPESKHLGRVE